MKALPWFRMYHEALDDEKLRLLAFEDRWHFVALLCCKAKGILDEGSPELIRRKVAVKLGLASRELDEVARRLAEVDLINKNTLQPKAWAERQCQSDKDETNAQRQARYRASHKATVTDSNALRNASVTGIDTDKEEDTDKTAGFDSFWSAYPKKTAKPAALLKFKSAKLKAGELDSILIDIETRSQSDDWTKENGKYVPNPATYLNQRRWEDGETAHMRKPGGVLPGAI